MSELSPAITQALCDAQDGPGRERLLQLVYNELVRIARAELNRHRRGHTLDTRALVHEMYIKLFDRGGLAYENRKHFYATCARAMRQVVVDHARYRQTQRRGGDAARIDSDVDVLQVSPVDLQAEQLLTVDRALQNLANLDERLVRVMEMRYFAGMEIKDIADVLGVSEPTIKRDIRAAKAFLHQELA